LQEEFGGGLQRNLGSRMVATAEEKRLSFRQQSTPLNQELIELLSTLNRRYLACTRFG